MPLQARSIAFLFLKGGGLGRPGVVLDYSSFYGMILYSDEQTYKDKKTKGLFGTP